MRDTTTDRPDPGRRAFLAGTAALSAAAGLEGILAARRAPAFAQGTKLHLLRWVDFIPACDVALKQDILPAASKALGAEIQLETVNGNDLQPRITAAIQSGSGPTSSRCSTLAPPYQNALVDMTDLGECRARTRVALRSGEAASKDGKRGSRCPGS